MNIIQCVSERFFLDVAPVSDQGIQSTQTTRTGKKKLEGLTNFGVHVMAASDTGLVIAANSANTGKPCNWLMYGPIKKQQEL